MRAFIHSFIHSKASRKHAPVVSHKSTKYTLVSLANDKEQACFITCLIFDQNFSYKKSSK